ncbi:DUF397 domain-containing protein [Streptomyces justiciae]|uniref:DUF397 domain-containing protein n=1 Tax=Streptomyces justiciae TaxID=2780140 RepID=A0ABU3LR02_9ACTN|nr:DUF397 domain-containing protein [Streptomyces justiciae]MDT7840982.1 DUF397 domain-containing protein [Streptomyces justiciae]
MDNWRKSSYSGPDDGNECVEISNTATHVSIRDSKTPTSPTLTISTTIFTPFIEALKTTTPSP